MKIYDRTLRKCLSKANFAGRRQGEGPLLTRQHCLGRLLNVENWILFTDVTRLTLRVLGGRFDYANSNIFKYLHICEKAFRWILCYALKSCLYFTFGILIMNLVSQLLFHTDTFFLYVSVVIKILHHYLNAIKDLTVIVREEIENIPYVHIEY